MDKLPTNFDFEVQDIEDYDVEPIKLDLKGFEDTENIIWIGNPHIISQLSQILFGSILMITTVLTYLLDIWNIFNVLNNTPITGESILVFGLIASVFIFLSSYISIKYTLYVLTDQAIYLQSGLIRRRVKRLPADTIQTHEYSQGVIERILNFGTIEVTTAGTDEVELKYKFISKPKKIHLIIGNLIEDRSYYAQIDDEDEYREKLLSEINNLSNKIED